MIPKTIARCDHRNGKYDIYGSSTRWTPSKTSSNTYVYPLPGSGNPYDLERYALLHDLLERLQPMPWPTSISPKIEFILVQHPWMENDCLFADISCPSNTKFEEEDIGADNISLSVQQIYLEEKPSSRAANRRATMKSSVKLPTAWASRSNLPRVVYTRTRSR